MQNPRAAAPTPVHKASASSGPKCVGCIRRSAPAVSTPIVHVDKIMLPSSFLEKLKATKDTPAIVPVLAAVIAWFKVTTVKSPWTMQSRQASQASLNL